MRGMGEQGQRQGNLGSHHAGIELRSSVTYLFFPPLFCAFLGYASPSWLSDSFSLFFFCFPGPAVSIVDFTVGSTKLRLSPSPSPSFLCHCKSTAFFGRGVSGRKIGTRCCCIFFTMVDKWCGGSSEMFNLLPSGTSSNFKPSKYSELKKKERFPFRVSLLSFYWAPRALY